MQISSAPRDIDDRFGTFDPGLSPVDGAKADLEAYDSRHTRYGKKARFFSQLSVAIAFLIAALGALTAITDTAILGVATAILAAVLTAVETTKKSRKHESKATIYLAAHWEAKSELNDYLGHVNAYESPDGSEADAERLREIELRKQFKTIGEKVTAGLGGDTGI